MPLQQQDRRIQLERLLATEIHLISTYYMHSRTLQGVDVQYRGQEGPDAEQRRQGLPFWDSTNDGTVNIQGATERELVRS